MDSIFPTPIHNLPKADIPIEGLTAFLSQGKNHQIVFMEFDKDVDLPEHSHGAQAGFVLSGKIDLCIDGHRASYVAGDIYHIPADAPHFGRIYAGYADISFFADADRYQQKTENQ